MPQSIVFTQNNRNWVMYELAGMTVCVFSSVCEWGYTVQPIESAIEQWSWGLVENNEGVD